MHRKRTEEWRVTRILLAIGIGAVLRTLEWWVTRILLAIGIGAVLFAGLLLLSYSMVSDPTETMSPLRMGASLLALAGLLGVLFGLAWMIRIFRDLRKDEPPPWRYRDR
jgi:hypothetical protein